MELNGAELPGPEAEEYDEGVEVELSLGLSIRGGGRRAAAATVGQGLQLSDSGDADVDPADDTLGSVTLSLSSGGDPLDQQQRREQHARRRQEVRKKRQQRKGIYRGAAGPAGLCSLEAQERRSRPRDWEAPDDEGRWADRSPLCGKHKKIGSEVHNQNPSPNRGPVRPMQYPYPQPQVQYVPVVKLFGVPCMMPCWAPAISVNSDGSIRPTARLQSKGSSSLDLNGGMAIAAKLTPSADSHGSSSSGISVHASGSFQGESSSSCEARSQARVERPQSHVSLQVSNPQGNSTQATKEGVDDKLVQSAMATNKKFQGANSVNKPISAAQDSKSSSSLSLSQMPCVVTTGDGPNGKTIIGFLYGYARESEVNIVCVCHGSSFSPAEFVKHAGGTNIFNPLRQIVVVPS